MTRLIWFFLLNFILINFSGCNYFTHDEHIDKVDRNSSADTGRIHVVPEEEPALIAISKKYEDSLMLLYPLFTKENCALYSPETLLKKITKQCEKNDYSINDFTSEAGEDYFFIIYASLLKQLNDSLMSSQTETIRISLTGFFSSVNGSFSCISDGGTMYYHNTNRIPGYVEWELANGRKKNYKANDFYSIKDIEKELILKGTGYQKEKIKEYQKSKEDISNCITLPLNTDSIEYKSWIIERTLNFISEQF